MAKATKTVKAKIGVVYNEKGYYEASGSWVGGRRGKDKDFIDEARDRTWDSDDLPHVCIVDVELPIPEPVKPPKGKVVEVKATE